LSATLSVGAARWTAAIHPIRYFDSTIQMFPMVSPGPRAHEAVPPLNDVENGKRVQAPKPRMIWRASDARPSDATASAQDARLKFRCTVGAAQSLVLIRR
jgi:hypothetical protein